MDEFYLECNFYGDDQMTLTTVENGEYVNKEDKTGFMAKDTPAILDIAKEQDIWVLLHDDEAGEAAEGGATEAELPTEPEFDPNPDYDMYTVVEYTIEDIQADLVCTVSAKADLSEFYLECNFYGDDQMTLTVVENGEYVNKADKTGFMAGDTPAILDKAQEQDLWVSMNGDDAAAEKKYTEADLPTEPEFDPNEDYYKYTVVEYTIEDIQADLVCTISTNEAMDEFYLECNFYGDDQMTRTVVSADSETGYEVLEDATGFMAVDTPAILNKAIEQDIWVLLHDDEAAEAGEGATEADLPTEPEFDPNPDYAYYTVVEYTIEDIQADLVCTISTNEAKDEFYLECNFYGDDQMTRTTYDGSEYTVLEDATGFMAGDTPAILDIALEQNIWVPIA